MSVNILRDGREFEYKLAEDHGNGNSFSLQDENGNKILVEIPLALDGSFSDKLFDIYFFSKRNIKESDIFQVYVREKDTRIGWLIPTLALSSTFHDNAENEHFLKYAYIAVRESLRCLNKSIFSHTVDGNEGRVGFADIFHDFTAILLISRETLSESIQFNVHRASPSLIRYGYVQLGASDPGRVRLNRDAPTGQRLYIEQISHSINNEELISELLNYSFAVEDSPVFKFFLLYQLFELLIEEIYRIEQTDIVNELVTVRGDSGKTKECIEKLNKFMSERSRLSLLIQKYTQPGINLAELQRLCNSLLKNLGKEEGDSFQEYFYRVRNFIFHQYRDFPAAEISSLEAIVDELLDVLPCILAEFGQQHSA